MKVRRKHAGEAAREYALSVIKENIISFDLAPGSSININELAAQLGISRTPIREAILELSNEKIIEVYPQIGSMVSYVDFEIANDARFVRLAIERAVIEEACERATQQDIEELQLMLKMQELYLENGSAAQVLEQDNDFHRKLFEIGGKEAAFFVKDYLSIHFDRIRSLRLNAIRDSKTVNEHRAIVEAVKNKDKEMARSAIDKHLSGYSLEEQTQMREKYPQYFKK
ncbi:GntR family transcriptional regulator [Konateibacter massiliensis]|uniref:GntR family transcriptional regulator n=1 Tax=Konateibacter massiliensis TaxID=2002841 RepID=UPI000C1553C9|nr:GntR family transcriptional regulator [Konateibacter massiliensis]